MNGHAKNGGQNDRTRRDAAEATLDQTPAGEAAARQQPKTVGADETIEAQSTRRAGVRPKVPDGSGLAGDALTLDSQGTGRPSGSGTAPEFLRRTVGADGSEWAENAPLPREIEGYSILRELGRGGMGVVYQARHEQLDRDVALKMILAGHLAGTQALRRFETEARSVARLQHPNILQIFDVGMAGDNAYIALEFVNGRNLADTIRHEPMSPDAAARVMVTIAQAVQHAHDHNVLHRDLKPANVLMTREGVPKVSDFGLAKQLDDQDDARTTTGAILGTPSYMSPEQAAGASDRVGPASDQYSLGSMLYALITGRPPFMSAKPIDTVSKVLSEEPIPPRRMVAGLPRDLETICLKTLQKNPAQRYPSCAAFAEDLQRFLNREPIVARPVSGLERVWRWCRRNPRIALPTGVAAGLLAGLITLGCWSYAAIAEQKKHAEDNADRAQQNALLAQANERKAQDNEAIARKNEELAKQNELLARQNEAIAQGREADARAQALALMKNVQFIITDVDQSLANTPGTTEVRLKVAQRQAEVWDQLDASVRNDVQGEAIPTLMAVRMRLGLLFEELGKIDLALDQVDKLVEFSRQRVEVKNRSDASRVNLARINLFAALLRDRYQRDLQQSLTLKKEAVATMEEVLADPRPEPGSPSQYEIHELLAEAVQRVGLAAMNQGNLEVSTPLLLRAMEIRRANFERLDDTPQYLNADEPKRKLLVAEAGLALDKSLMSIAYTLIKTGKAEEGLREFAGAIESRRKAAEEYPEQPMIRQEYGRTCGLYGECLLWNGKLEEAAAQIDESVSVANQAWLADQQNVELRRQLALALYRRACLREQTGDADGEQADAQAALEHRLALFEATKGAKDEVDLAIAAGRQGDSLTARPILDRFAASTTPDPEIQLKCARACSQLSRRAEGELRDALWAEALDTLRRAIAEGYSDPYKVRTEADFFWRRDVPEFEAAVPSIKK